jgi:hypothetical protein
MAEEKEKSEKVKRVPEMLTKSYRERYKELFKEKLRQRLRAKMIRGDFGPESQKKAIRLKQERDAAMIEKRDSTLH